MVLLFTVAKQIVDLHGGRIGVYSEGESRGSTFFFEIPLVSSLDALSYSSKSRLYARREFSSLVESHFQAEQPRRNSGASGVPRINRSVLVGSANEESKGAELYPGGNAKEGDDHEELKRHLFEDDISEKVEREMTAPVWPYPYPSRAVDQGHRYSVTDAGPLAETTAVEGQVRVPDSAEPKVSSLASVTFGALPGAIEPPGASVSSEVPVLTALLVDDAATNRKMMSRLLMKSYHVTEAEDGCEAVAAVERLMAFGKEFDLVLMDFVMPNMDGPTATKRIRELGYKGIIVGVTGNALSFDVQKFISSGADKVLSKPLKIDDLISTMSGKSYPLALLHSCPIRYLDLWFDYFLCED